MSSCRTCSHSWNVKAVRTNCRPDTKCRKCWLKNCTANDPQTRNDSQIGLKMIPNRKWFQMWTANDTAGKRGWLIHKQSWQMSVKSLWSALELALHMYSRHENCDRMNKVRWQSLNILHLSCLHVWSYPGC